MTVGSVGKVHGLAGALNGDSVALKNGFLNLLLLKQGMHCPFLSALHLEKNPLLLLVLCSL
jgi:hypothetical protein